MKRLKRALACSALGLVLASLLVLGSSLASRLSGATTESREELVSTRAYWLAPDDALTFSLEAGRGRLRLHANAALPASSLPGPDEHYSLRYRVLDDRGVELRADAYYLRLRGAVEPGSPGRSFLEHDAVPSAPNLFYLDLTDEPGATTLELSPGSATRPLAAIALRPYYQELRRSDRLERIWERLHESARERLARPNALGLEFLSAAEQRNLVRTRWRPAVPRGIEGVDYAVVQLVEEEVEAALPAQGSPVGEERWLLRAGQAASLGLTAPTRLLIAASGVAGPLLPGELEVRWHGRLRHERADIVLAPVHGHLETVAELDRGIVTFEAQADVWLETVDSERAAPLEPAPNLVRAYDVSDAAVLIPVRHLPDLPTPVRLDLRAEAGEPGEVEVVYLADGVIEETHTLPVGAGATRFEVLRLRGERRALGERTRVHLRIPAGVDMLRVSSAGRVWLSAYNRPPDLPRRVLIPESLFGGNGESRHHPAWFVLAPQNAVAFEAAGSTALIESHLQPPAEADLTSELALTERLYPEQDWRGISVLARNDPRREISPRGRRANYRRLETGVHDIELAAAPGAMTVAPTLLVRRDSGNGGRLRISTVGERILDRFVSGRVGRLVLPAVSAGRQRWMVEAPQGIALYLSHLQGADDSYREHSVQALGAGPFTYRLRRASSAREVLTLRLFSAVPGRLKLGVSLSPWARSGQPQRDWTLMRIDYDLALEESGRLLPLDEASRQLPFEGLLFHAVGSDVPAGELTLTVEVLDAAGELAAGEAPALYLGVTRASTELAPEPALRVHRFEVSEP